MTIIDSTSLPLRGTASRDFQGAGFGSTLSFIWADIEPGAGPPLHSHPYEEVFVVYEGEATLRVGDETLVASAGQVVVGPADVPHAFVNTGDGPLRSVNIHAHPTIETVWLE